MGKQYKPFNKKKDVPAEPPKDVRLNRFISNAGITSRREADTLISEGKVKVNGKVVTELGTRVKKSDKVVYQGKVLQAEKLQYVLLNKPKDFITTMSDTHNRKTVMSLVDKACPERIYPVGRLDRPTTGLLMFTNDGELAKKLTHPSHKIRKIYHVELDKALTQADFDRILEGVELDDGIAKVNELAQVGDNPKSIGLEIHIGRNRVVRRIFEKLGYRVQKLDRVMFANLTKKDLQRGKWRHLNVREVQNLKNMVKKK
ncbi:MAG: rRNA pseudouridine synthase [Cyclobacteriaceae bacterium]